MSAMYDHQRADINRICDSSRALTPLMRQWMQLAESRQTDLGYDDWKTTTRKTRRQVGGTADAAGERK